jgi:hypothetical protein
VKLNGFRGDFPGRKRQVAFIFSIFIVHQDDDAPRTHFGEGRFHIDEWWELSHTQSLSRRQFLNG